MDMYLCIDNRYIYLYVNNLIQLLHVYNILPGKYININKTVCLHNM